MCGGLCTPLPTHIPLPHKKPRSGEEWNALELKNKWPRQNMPFNYLKGSSCLSPRRRLYTKPASTNKPLCEAVTHDLLPTTVCSGSPNTSVDPPPMANRREIRAGLPESQVYPNKTENFHFQTNSVLEMNSGIKVQMVSPVAR